MHAFKQAFLMFDPDDPAKKIIDEFVVNPPNGNYLGLSQPFVDKHFANDDADAKKKAEARNAKDTDIKVSSFLTPNDMLDFNKEVCACEPFFMALLARFKRKDASYRGRNKRVEGLVIRSSTKYAKIQCTEANKFTPRPDPPEYLTYGIATPSPDKVICDHYEPYKTVFQGLGKLDINPGWIMLDYKNKRDKQNKLLVDVQPPYEIGVYVKFGTFD